MAKLVLILIILGFSAGCIGSDKPRRVLGSQALEKPYIPPVNPDLLVPAELLRADTEYYKDRKAIEAIARPPYNNSWDAADEHIKRVLTPKKRDES